MSISTFAKKRSVRVGATVVVIVLLAAAIVTVGHARRSGLVVHEIAEEGAVVRSSELQRISISAANPDDLSSVRVSVDGAAVSTHRDGDRLTTDPLDLAEGMHSLAVRMPNPLPLLPATGIDRVFTVDNTAPTLSVDPVDAKSLEGPITVAGKALGAESVLVGDQRVPIGDGDAFSVSLPSVPDQIRVEAKDAAGNTELRDLPVHARHPGMRGVHMSALAWASESLREPVLRLAREHKIDTVQLDIKDESGEIGYDSQVPLAKKIGASKNYYDVRAVLDQLHAAGLRVVGRLVAFRDPVLAESAWKAGSKDLVVQDESGQPWSGGYGGHAFTNFANPEVRAYNIELAIEASTLGFDDILYDYVRRPDGPISRMRFPGLKTSPEQSITEFLRDSRKAVRPRGAFVGASVFGVAARAGSDIAQDIPSIAAQVDYVAPMVYPSHWGPGEYGVADPEGQPREIVRNSVADFVGITKDSGAAVIPWLQAFSLAKSYGAAEVQAQVSGAAEAGAQSFLLWNAACDYGSAGLQAK